MNSEIKFIDVIIENMACLTIDQVIELPEVYQAKVIEMVRNKSNFAKTVPVCPMCMDRLVIDIYAENEREILSCVPCEDYVYHKDVAFYMIRHPKDGWYCIRDYERDTHVMDMKD